MSGLFGCFLEKRKKDNSLLIIFNNKHKRTLDLQSPSDYGKK